MALENSGNPTKKIDDHGTIRVISPQTGREIKTIQSTEVSNIENLVAETRVIQAEWQCRPLQERARLIKKVKVLLGTYSSDIVDLLEQEIGRYPAESWFAEIVPNIDLVQWWTTKGLKHLGETSVFLNPLNFPKKKASVRFVPRGVVGLITPWNYPVAIPLRNIVPAVLSGNAVIWKPSEYAAAISELVARIFHEALGLDVVRLVQGGASVAREILSFVDAVGFTGGVETGKSVAVRAAERLIPASLELGGKDVAVVFADADLPRTAAGIVWGALTNCGQNCASIEIIAVEKSISSEFTELLKSEMKKMAPFIGPVVTENQKEKVQSQIDDAQSKNATIWSVDEGTEGPLQVKPRLITNVSVDALVFKEETFGPLLPVIEFTEKAEIDRLFAQSDYGLTCSIWTSSIEQCMNWAKKLPVGVLVFNNHSFSGGIPSLPWSGVKNSGFGITNSKHSLDWLVRPQAVVVDKSKQRELWWHPYTKSAIDLCRGLTAMNSGTGPKGKALTQMISSMLKRWKDQ